MTSRHNGSVYAPHHRTRSPFRPPPLEPLVLSGYKSSTPLAARLLSRAVAEEIRNLVPTRLQIASDWTLTYSLEQDGASLATLYERLAAYEGRRVGFVLVVRDDEGGTFGAYLSEAPRPQPKYFGNGECFLWRASVLAALPPPPSADTTSLTRSSTIPSAPETSFRSFDTTPSASEVPSLSSSQTLSAGGGDTDVDDARPSPSPGIRFKAFPYSGENDYYMFCETGYISVGAGDGQYGLWMDGGLERGISQRSQTFGNEPLSDQGVKFGILGVEMWVIGARPVGYS
jgi:hypothetical protein